jgi:hypothetical protein
MFNLTNNTFGTGNGEYYTRVLYKAEDLELNLNAIVTSRYAHDKLR